MRKLQALVSFLLLICAFGIEAKSPPPGTGKADVPANIYIMLDTSGSMGATVNQVGRMYYPRDVGVDSNGNMYIVEYYYHRIRKYDSAGNFVKTFGSYGSGAGRFYYPTRIDVDSNDNLYIADRNGVSKYDSNGSYITRYSGASNIIDVAVDDSTGDVYGVTSRSVYKWRGSGGSYITSGSGYFNGLDFYNGSLYTAGRSTRNITKYSSALGVQNTWSLSGNSYVGDVEVTSNGIYVACEGHCSRIQKYSLSGVYERQFGSFSSSSSSGFYYLYGIASDSSGNIYGTSFYTHSVKKFDSNGTFLSFAGPPSETRMSEVLKVIEKLTSSSDLTRGANFGLQDWASYATQRIRISSNGAAEINKSVSPKIMKNGSLITNPDYKGSSWYNPSGGTNLDRAMEEAQSYFNGSNSPIDSNAGCQKNFLIVISDGQWFGSKSENIAKSLLATKGIQTLVVGFHSGGNQTNYIKLAKAGGTHPDSPLFSNNWQQLYETMSAFIRQAISSRLTFSAPVVMPNISSGDHIFQSTFTFKSNHQWEGQLSKYKLTSNNAGSFKAGVGALQWDAGAKLDAKSESSRNIWTVANPFGVSTSLNNFTASNVVNLKRALWENSGTNPTDAQATKLINFVRGVDSYDENKDNSTTDKRWKLGDIFNSRLVVVGPPKGKTTSSASKDHTEAYYRHKNGYKAFKTGASCGVNCAVRDEVVYVGANDGMLHAFDSSSGEELWAFIPPMMLPSLKSMISVKANSSNAIYGVDGSPMVKDIFYNNKWRTVLISGMGRGGFGYFALDVTNSSSPSFLFAFENKPSLNLVSHWDENGTRTDLGYASNIPAEFDYTKIGETLSTPVIVALPVGTGNNRKWVAVFGGGYNSGINTNFGSSVYVVDLEDAGKVVKRFDLNDLAGDPANSMPSSLVSITPDTTSKAKYKGALVYGADLESKLWQLNLTDQGTMYDFTSHFDAEATTDNDRLSFFQITPSIGSDDNLWTFYGTGNQQRLQRMSNDIDNRIFGIKDKNFPTYKNISGATPKASSMKNMSTAGSSCPVSTDLGWYINMGSNERITGKLAVFNEVVYATRYLPNQGQICSPGKAYLSEHNMTCGSESRKTELGEGIATGAVVHKNIVYIGISGGGSGEIKDSKGNVIGKKEDNIILLSPSGSGVIGDGKISQESWREIY